MNEEWRVVSDNDAYEVSNFGRVRNKSGLIFKPNISRGYRIVTLSNPRKRIPLHRLVALAFIPNPENKTQVNHKDGDKSNNHFNNLEWCTQSENIKHAYSLGLMSRCGERHHLSKLDECEVMSIKERLSNGEEASSIAKDYNVLPSCIRRIKNGSRWSHLNKEK